MDKTPRLLRALGPLAVIAIALFLASPRARFTTGAALPIDGGIKEAMPR